MRPGAVPSPAATALALAILLALTLPACDASGPGPAAADTGQADAGAPPPQDASPPVADRSSEPSDAVPPPWPDGHAADGRVSDGRATDARAGDASPPPASDLERLRALVAALPAAATDSERQRLVTEFFAAVAYGERGFPIREQGQLAVALSDSRGGALTVAGDFNGWDAAALPLSQPVPGFPFYYRIQPLAEPLPRTLYKLVRNQSEWFADPAARRHGWDSYGQYSLAEAGDAQSHLERWPAFGQNAGALRPRDLVVYVPAGYQTSGDCLPVLYMHDGQNLFDPEGPWGSWRAGEAADGRIAAGAIVPLLIVGIFNTPERMDEYTHVQDGIGGGNIVGGRAAEYVDFLVNGVKPFIEARYRVAASGSSGGARAATAIVGSSLGGLVSFYAAWRYPQVFDAAGSMSGTFGWGQMGLSNPTMMDLFVQQPPPVHSRFYLDSGGGPGARGCAAGGGEDNYCETVEMADTLRGLGFADGVDLFYQFAPGGEHNEAAWAARLPALLGGWFKPPRSSCTP